MPLLFISGSDGPELDTWRGDLLRAAARSVSPADAILSRDTIANILADKFPGLLAMWGPIPDFEKIGAKRLLAEVRERHRSRHWTRNNGLRRKAVSRRRPAR
jgi:hypothetical protein